MWNNYSITKTTAPTHKEPSEISSTLTMSEEYDIKHFGKVLDKDYFRFNRDSRYIPLSRTER